MGSGPWARRARRKPATKRSGEGRARGAAPEPKKDKLLGLEEYKFLLKVMGRATSSLRRCEPVYVLPGAMSAVTVGQGGAPLRPPVAALTTPRLTLARAARVRGANSVVLLVLRYPRWRRQEGMSLDGLERDCV